MSPLRQGRLPGGWSQRHTAAVCGTAAMALLLVSLVCLGAFTAGVRGVFGAVPLLSSSSQPAGNRPPSALLQTPTAARCNRLYLPASLANTSAVPSYPAAVKDPVSGEWLMFFSYQEVRPLATLSLLLMPGSS